MDTGTEPQAPNRYASPEELRYARVLELGSRIGLLLLIGSFALYVFDILKPLVPLANLPKYWGLSAHDYLIAAHEASGWGWVRQLGYADVAILVPIAFLAAVSAVCSLAVLPQFIRRRDRTHAAILILQVVVVALAASSVFAPGH